MKTFYLNLLLFSGLLCYAQAPQTNNKLLLGIGVDQAFSEQIPYSAANFRVAVFSYNKLALGAKFDYYLSEEFDDTYNTLRAGVFARVYFLTKKFRPFVGGDVTYNYLKFKFGEKPLKEEQLENNIMYGPTLGIAYFFNQTTSIDLSCQYKFVSGPSLYPTLRSAKEAVDSGLELGLGVTFLL